jgi:hypothetical protein
MDLEKFLELGVEKGDSALSSATSCLGNFSIFALWNEGAKKEGTQALVLLVL